jgi:SNF2 family DNA or RNA helicase
MIPALYDFQKTGVRFLLRTGRAILADDMGLGKTVQAIAACEESGAGRVLVVCPNTLKANWAAEIEKWAPGRCVSVLRGTREEKREAIKEFGVGYLIINIEAVRPVPDLLGALLGISWDVLIVDEAHSVKNRKAAQTKGVRLLASRVQRVYLLTGTPIMNRVDDLWSPLNILYPRRFPSYWSFVRRHTSVYKMPMVFWSGKEKRRITRIVWQVDGRPTWPEGLRAEVGSIILRREKEEVFPDMPRKVYQQVWLDLEGEQLRIYREIEETAMAEVNEGMVVETPGILAQLTRCKQVAVSPGLIGGPLVGVKVDALMDIVRGTDQKILVFSQFAGAIRFVAGLLEAEGMGHAVLTGDTKEEDRHGVIETFQTNPGCRVFLATTQAGGSGVNLTAASVVVFLDKCWTPAVNEQAVDRTRPHMQTRPVQIVELLGRDTVDEMIEDVLAGKVGIIEAVINKKRRRYA